MPKIARTLVLARLGISDVHGLQRITAKSSLNNGAIFFKSDNTLVFSANNYIK